MKVLLVNKFLYRKGGDAIYTLAVGKLLEEKNHCVAWWGMDHPDNPNYVYRAEFVSFVDLTKSSGILSRLRDTARILYSFESRKKFERVINLFNPDIVHVNNFAHQISPSILSVSKKYNLPVVMTMHDYKLVCPVYTMISNGDTCEKCKYGRYYNCFKNRCTKNSYIKSFVNILEMYLHHRILKIYNEIDILIAPSRFLKKKIIEMGFTAEIEYLPNFVNFENQSKFSNSNCDGLVYAGRLSPEKGVLTLLKAKKGLSIPLKIIGDGPQKKELQIFCEKNNLNDVKFLGYLTGERLKHEIAKSLILVLPSEWYENGPLSVLEAYALSKPVIGSRAGGIPELIKNMVTGLNFTHGNVRELRERIKYVIDNKKNIVKMGLNARNFVKNKFNSEKHYSDLMEIYHEAIKRRDRKGL